MKNLTLMSLAAALTLASCGDESPASAAPATVQVVVVQKSGSISSLSFASATVRSSHSRSGLTVLDVGVNEVSSFIQSVRQTGSTAEINAVAVGGAVPDDAYYASQWHLDRIQAASAWDGAVGDSRAVMAVIDSGIEAAHPDLDGRILPGWCFLDESTDTHDRLGHGTAVAGVLAAETNNAGGVSGVTWRGKILPLVVLNESNQATYADIARAIIYAADAGARIINVSIGGTDPSDALQAAVDYAWALGCVVFAASMNNGDTAPMYPAACDHVVAVGASAYDDSRAEFSNYGSWIDLVAPGEGILTTSTGAAYGPWTGTSMATPIAAGVAALILAANPGFTAQELVDRLTGSCDDLGVAGWDEEFGAGRVNAAAALAGTPPLPTEDPAQTTEPPAGATTSTASAGAVEDEQSRVMQCASSTGSAGGAWMWMVMAAIGLMALMATGKNLPR